MKIVNIGVMMVFNYKIKQTEFLTVFLARKKIKKQFKLKLRDLFTKLLIKSF